MSPRLPTWKQIIVLDATGQAIKHTRRYWLVLDHYLDHGEAPAGYTIVLPGPRVKCLGMAEEVEARARKRSRKRATPAQLEAPAETPTVAPTSEGQP